MVYRIKNIPEDRLKELIQWLAEKGIKMEGQKSDNPYAIVDETGVGYNTPRYLRTKRGQEIRKVDSHIKGIAIGYWQGGSVWIVGVNVDRAYSDEGRLLKEHIMEYGLCGLSGGVKIVGDRLYG